MSAKQEDLLSLRIGAAVVYICRLILYISYVQGLVNKTAALAVLMITGLALPMIFVAHNVVVRHGIVRVARKHDGKTWEQPFANMACGWLVVDAAIVQTWCISYTGPFYASMALLVTFVSCMILIDDPPDMI